MMRRTSIRGLESKIKILRSERRGLLLDLYAGIDAEKAKAKKARIDAIQEILQKLEDQLADVRFVIQVDELLRPRSAPKN